MFFITIICCLFIFASSSLDEKDRGTNVTTLRFVHAIWRHGDRTAATTFPTGNPLWRWSEGIGELTTVGMRQHQKLGAYLRKRYVDSGFLSKEYNSSEIYVYSTDYNRTIMSAMSNLAGMYPPDNECKDGFLWKPVPVHTRPVMDDPIVWPEYPCPKADEILFNEIFQSNDVKKLEADNEEFLELLRNKTGLKLEKGKWLNDLKLIYDPLSCEYFHNRTWPSWVTPDIFKKLTELFFKFYQLYTHDPRLHRLRGGLLFQEIAGRFERKAKNQLLPTPLKYYAYSAHDTTLLIQLENYGSYDGNVPAYATALLYELHETQPGKFTVEIWYVKNQGDVPPTRIKVQGCDSEICHLDRFVTLAKSRNITEDSYYIECGLNTTKFN